MIKIKLAKRSDCTGCMACVDSCSRSAISSIVEKDGHRYPIINYDLCVRCGVCMKKCPELSHFNYVEDIKALPYLSWAKDDKIRLRGASGGIFGAIAHMYWLKMDLFVDAQWMECVPNILSSTMCHNYQIFKDQSIYIVICLVYIEN